MFDKLGGKINKLGRVRKLYILRRGPKQLRVENLNK